MKIIELLIWVNFFKFLNRWPCPESSMNRKFLLTGMILLVIGITIAGIQVAHAQDSTAIEDIDDSTVIIILIAAITGGMAAPIVGFASKKEGGFNWKQYGMAVIVGIPASLGLIMAEILALQFVIGNFASVVMLFLLVFTQALGIDYAKSRAKRAITN